MTNIVYNIIILVTCWLLISGAGVYVTFFQQPAEVERLEKAEKVARMRQSEVTALFSEEAISKSRAEEISKRWNARYKVIPQQIRNGDVIAYLNELTRTGFKNFDLKMKGSESTPNYRYYRFAITGRGFYSDFYRVIWELENNRSLYRVENLDLNHIDLITQDPGSERERLEIMVSFSFDLSAYYGGAEGLSAADVGASGGEDPSLPWSTLHGLPEVPDDVLPARWPAVNPFLPLIMAELPPNTDGLLEIEEATLISIVDGKAIFEAKEDGSFRTVGLGDPVYLGQVIEVDPIGGRVVVRLNKGGIIDEVELQMQMGESYRQALGNIRLAPTETY